MARPIQITPQQKEPSMMDTFRKELPGLMLRYVFDRMARTQASELQEQRMNYELNLNVVSDYITDLNQEKRRVEEDLAETKEGIEGSIAALKAHSVKKPHLDQFTTTAGSSTIPDYILNNLILSDENKEIIGNKASTVQSLSKELKFYKGQEKELITVNAALDKIEKIMEKGQIDPALVGSGMMGYVTDKHDMQAFWEKTFAEAFADHPYEDIVYDVFMQQTPTSSDQATQIAKYVDETEALRKIDENQFLSTATSSLSTIQTYGQTAWQGFHDPDDSAFDITDTIYDDLRGDIKRYVGFVSNDADANKYILNSVRNMATYTDPFSFYVDVLDEQKANPIQTKIAEQFFSVPVREMREAHTQYSGQYNNLFQILQAAKTKQNISLNQFQSNADIEDFSNDILNIFKDD